MKSEDEIALERLWPMLFESRAGGHIKDYNIERETVTIDCWPIAKTELNGIVHVTIDGERKTASRWLKDLEGGLAPPEFRATRAKYIFIEEREG